MWENLEELNIGEFLATDKANGKEYFGESEAKSSVVSLYL